MKYLELSTMKDENRFLPTYTGCMVCGQPDQNPNTLNLRFQVTKDGVEVKFTSNFKQAGYEGVVHGGIICSLLDETIGWAVAVERRKFFVTMELNVKFRRPLPVGLTVTVKGRPVEHKSRYSLAEGEIIDEQGIIYASATGKFFLMKDKDAQKIDEYLMYQENDLKVLQSMEPNL